MRICCAISGFSSMLSLTMRTAPLAPRTTFSRIGPNCLQGPHHGAQKSTITGWSNEASTTSAMKFAVFTSLTTAAPAAAAPIIGSFVMRSFSPEYPAKHGARAMQWQAPPPHGDGEEHSDEALSIDDHKPGARLFCSARNDAILGRGQSGQASCSA